MKNVSRQAGLLSLVILILIKPVNAFVSPSTLQLLVTSAGSFLWGLLISIIITLLIFVKKINPKLVLILISVLGLLFGYGCSNFLHLKDINTYSPLSKDNDRMITYDECVQENYLDFLPKGNITIIDNNEMIYYLLKNKGKLNILNIGLHEAIQFKNEIFINQSLGEIETAVLKTADLNKNEPLFMYCSGARSSSVVAQFLANKGFTNIFLLRTDPVSVIEKMHELDIDTTQYFNIVEPGDGGSIIRVSLDSKLLKKADNYYFYKVNNCDEYIQSYNILTSENTVCSDDINFSFFEDYTDFSKIHFLCDNDKLCDHLHTILLLSGRENIGYLVVLHE